MDQKVGGGRGSVLHTLSRSKLTRPLTVSEISENLDGIRNQQGNAQVTSSGIDPPLSTVLTMQQLPVLYLGLQGVTGN